MNFYQQFEAYLKGEDNDITNHVNSDAKGDATERMDIYRDAYRLRLIDILYGDFPTLYQILGTEDFTQMADDYLAKCPSTSFTVRHFGQYLPQFLQQQLPYCDYPYLWQIADFEWAKGTVFDAPDTDIFTIEAATQMDLDDWQSARFTFIPAMTRLVYDYNVPQIWQAIADNQQDQEPQPLDKPMPWIMWRKDLNPHWYSMPTDEDAFFIRARQGITFADLCEELGDWLDDETLIAPRAAEIVRRWIDEKMLVRVDY